MDKWFFLTWVVLLLWGFAPILEKLALRDCDVLTVMLIRNFIITLILFAIAGAHILPKLKYISPKTYFYIVSGSICGGLLGMLAYFIVLKKLPASVVVPIVGAYPMVTALFSIILLRESIKTPQILGIILITIGIGLLSRYK